jgi:hypothetical protein
MACAARPQSPSFAGAKASPRACINSWSKEFLEAGKDRLAGDTAPAASVTNRAAALPEPVITAEARRRPARADFGCRVVTLSDGPLRSVGKPQNRLIINHRRPSSTESRADFPRPRDDLRIDTARALHANPPYSAMRL